MSNPLGPPGQVQIVLKQTTTYRVVGVIVGIFELSEIWNYYAQYHSSELYYYEIFNWVVHTKFAPTKVTLYIAK